MAPRGEAGKLLGAGTAVAAIGGAYKIGEFMNRAKRLHDVGPANAVYVRLVNRVRADLDEVQRLLGVPEIKDALASNKPKAKWVYGTIRDTRGALENTIPLTERVSGDIDEGRRVGWRHRIRWVLDEKEKLDNRVLELNTAHASLCEAIGFLTALEPVDDREKHKHSRKEEHRHHDHHDHRDERYVERDVYVDERERGPRVIEEREEWIERERGPRRVEERDVYVEERERGPTRYVEERDVYIDERERGPRRYEERETYVEREREHDHHHHHGREPRYEERYYDERSGRVDERELHLHRDPHHPGHVEADYYQHDPRHEEHIHYERRPGGYEEKRFEERRYRSSSDEDRVRDRETFMQSGPYGAPPYGAQKRREVGDPGFGDEEVLNPQPVPLDPDFEREVWIEEKEDYRYDEYGNRLPDRLIHNPRYQRSRL